LLCCCLASSACLMSNRISLASCGAGTHTIPTTSNRKSAHWQAGIRIQYCAGARFHTTAHQSAPMQCGHTDVHTQYGDTGS
jgi:hypothetical protein